MGNRKVNITGRQLGVLVEAVSPKADRNASEWLEMNGISHLYHATPSCYVSSIKKHGLGGKMPSQRFWDYKDTVYEGMTTGCFLSTDEYVAESYLDSSEGFYELADEYEEKYGKELEIIVFSVDVSALDGELLSFDENQQYGEDGVPTFFYNGVIPYSSLKMVKL